MPVGIEKNNKIKVTLLLNPFSVKERKEYFIERKNIGDILAENGLAYTKDILVIDGDHVIYGNKSVPHNNHLIIRLFPTGTGNTTQDIATGEKIAGGVLSLAGVIVAIAGAAAGLTGVGVAIAGAGVSLLLGGIIAYNTAVDIPTYEDTNQLPSLRGSSNQTRANGRIPILLGKHRIYPDNASIPYVDTDTNSIQTLNQLYCAGFSNLEIDMDTVKIGETFFYPDDDGLSSVFTNAFIKVNYGGTYDYTYYAGRRVDIHYGEKITYNNTTGQIPIVKTTPTNTNKFYIRLLFSNGLIAYDDDGDKKNHTVSFKVEYKKTTEDESSYKIIDPTIVLPTPSPTYNGRCIAGKTFINGVITTREINKNLIGQVVNAPYFPAGTKITKLTSEYYIRETLTNTLYLDGVASTTITSGFDFNVGETEITQLDYTTITNKTTSAFRRIFEVDLDNLLPSGDDYVANRQYDIRVTRISKESNSSSIVDNVVLESIKTENGVFDNAGGFDDTPIIESAKEKLTLVEMNMQATDQLNGVIDELNFEGTVKTRNYAGTGTGVGAWSTVEANRNPASMFLYVMTNDYINQHPVDDTKIDFVALEAWWLFCESKGFTCDAFINYDIITNDLLSNICTCGRASWNIVDGIYTVIIDTVRDDIVQMFTPRNSSNYSATKAFPDKPTVLSSQFVNEESGYVAETIDIYNRRITGTVSITAGTNILNGTGTTFTTDLSVGEIIQIGTETHTIQTITSDILLQLDNNHGVGAAGVNVYVEDDSISASSQLFGVTTSDHAWKLGKYQLAVSELRPVVHTFTADIENMICTKGDRIKLRHDVPLYGLFDGRVKSIFTDGSNVTGFTSDEIITMEAGVSYTVRFRQQTGTFVDSTAVNPGAGDYTIITLNTPISGTTSINIYDLFTFGETGSEDVDLIITEMQYSTDFEGTLTCVDYSPEIFNADTGTIPFYDSKISKQGDGAGSINPNNITDVEGSLESTIETVTSATESLTARFPDSFKSNYDQSYYFVNDEEYIYYVNYDNGNVIYKKNLDKVNNGTALTTDISGGIAHFGGAIIYVNLSQGSVLYKIESGTTGNGTAVTTNEAWCPVVDEIGNCYYINYSDGFKVYVCDINGVGNDGIEFLDKACVWISYGYGNLFYMEADGIVHRYLISDGTDTAITTGVINKFSVLDDDEIIVVKADDNIAYSINFDGSNETPEFEYADYVSCAFGNLLYSSGQLDNTIYPALATKVVGISALESSPSYATITGDITIGLNTIANISNVDLDKMAKGDFVIGVGIPDDTVVSLIGAGYIYMSNPATATSLSTVFEISGSRIFLNANKVIVPGTIEAELMEASALNSKARDVLGNPISEANLDAGTQIYRKADGTVVFDFDPNRTGEELKFAGTISGESTSVDENAGYILDAETGNATFNDITIKGTGNFGGLNVSHIFNGEKIFTAGVNTTQDVYTWLVSINTAYLIPCTCVLTIGTDDYVYVYLTTNGSNPAYAIRSAAYTWDFIIESGTGLLGADYVFKTIYSPTTTDASILPSFQDSSLTIGSSSKRFNGIYGKNVYVNKGLFLENNIYSTSAFTAANLHSTIYNKIGDTDGNKVFCSGWIHITAGGTNRDYYATDLECTVSSGTTFRGFYTDTSAISTVSISSIDVSNFATGVVLNF